ncbi:MAG: hypothetical protein E5Y10_19245 [Mesorhizobium sp.]|nr:MAG: hypothetical protein EOS13_20395 [Mesorhizobium sp.]TIN23099.1 MAG: hypothetical protein E5Y19_29000 [Mesorhizobium sp.]TIN36442.1 MAG: hypothetical protein E5Y13_23170 [Mesorhizobium sp.]TJU83237.1 MAG: hypothetical protein E5Y15_14700 [Mesorhizobium sp.]TJU87828.1 MAG: hypothetical protein E5Y10_19245 [Mesorhizobium sp.]
MLPARPKRSRSGYQAWEGGILSRLFAVRILDTDNWRNRRCGVLLPVTIRGEVPGRAMRGSATHQD